MTKLVYVALTFLALFALNAESKSQNTGNYPLPPIVTSDPPFGYCNSGHSCRTCIGDMFHMKSAFTYKVSQATTSVSRIIRELKVSITRLNTSSSDITIINRRNTNIVKTTLSVTQRVIITQLNKLLILIKGAGKGPDTSSLTRFLTIIYKSQGSLHVLLTNCQKFINLILINIKKSPSLVINKINRIRVEIAQVSQKLIVITQLFVKFKKIEKISVEINELKVAIESINVVVVNIEQYYKKIIMINQQIESRVKIINNNQQIQFQRIEAVINIIEQKNVEVIRNIESYSTHFRSVEVLIKNVDISMVHIAAQIKKVMITIFQNKNLLIMDRDVNLILNIITKFMSSHSKTVTYISDMIVKNLETYRVFKSIQVVVQRFASNVDKYIRGEKILMVNVLSSLDSLISIQNSNAVKINRLLVVLKTSLMAISKDTYRNSQSFSSTSVKVTSIKNKMAVVISTLKNLLTVCKCGGQPSACGFACPTVVDLVCANDQRTYTNECEMRRAGCKRKDTLRKVTSGKCSGTTGGTGPCIKPCPRIYAPVCGTNDADYDNVCIMHNYNCMMPAGHKVQVAHKGKCAVLTPKPSCRKLCGITRNNPRCGSDGNTYGNQCQLDNHNCDMPAHAKVTFVYQGKCIETTPQPEPPSCRKYCLTWMPVHLQYSPVCGSDDQTYANRCELDNSNCDRPVHAQVTVQYEGRCDGRNSPSGYLCKSGFYPIKGISGCFYVKKPVQTTSQKDGREDCEARGARLVTFTSDTEYAAMQAYLNELMTYKTKKNFWTAGHRKNESTKWVWLPKGSPMQLGKKSWAVDRPKFRINRCATMYGNLRYALMDVTCNTRRLSHHYGWVCRM